MNNEHDGKGGSYSIDPETGERKLVERTGFEPAAVPLSPNPSPASGGGESEDQPTEKE